MELYSLDSVRFDLDLSVEKERLSLVREKLDGIARHKPLGWQEQSAKLLRKIWNASPEEELSRLRDWGVIDESTETRLDRLVSSYVMTSSSLSLKQISAKVMVGRALEIQRIYGDTHRVFLHAQSSKWLVIPDLIKECMKVYYPEKDLHQFKCLRIPKNTAPEEGISKYKTSSTCDQDLKTRDEIISADGYFYNSSQAESSFYFVWNNSNIMSAFSPVALSLIQKFCPSLSDSKRREFAEKFVRQVGDDSSELGNLFVFCIPKEESEKIQYRAHPFGVVCDCHQSQDSDAILDQLQKGSLNQEIACKGYHSEPQFRLFTPELRKENGVKIYLIPSNPAYRKTLKGRVRALVQELVTVQEEGVKRSFIRRVVTTAYGLGMYNSLGSKKGGSFSMSFG